MAQGNVDNLFLLTDLIDRLENGSPAAQIQAARELAALEDTDAIAPLVKVYQTTKDKKVRKAAADALRVFRRVEQQQIASSGSAAAAIGNGSGGALHGLRRILAALLVITLLANLALLGYRIITGDLSLGGQTAAVPSIPREEHWANFAARLDLMTANAQKFRSMGAGIPANYALEQKPICEPLDDDSGLSQVTLAQIDMTTYPDIEPVNALINAATGKYQETKLTYNEICGTRDVSDFKARVDGWSDQNFLLTQSDTLINGSLNPARGELDRIIRNPLPTVGPTATASPLPSDTPTLTFTPSLTFTPLPTNTPGGPTETPTPAPTLPTDTPVPTLTDIPPTATPEPTITRTPEPTLDTNSQNVVQLSGRTFLFKISFEGVNSANQNFRATFDIRGTIRRTPLKAQYIINLSESNNGLQLGLGTGQVGSTIPDLLRTSGITGSVTFVTLDDVAYSLPARGNCAVRALSDASVEQQFVDYLSTFDLIGPNIFNERQFDAVGNGLTIPLSVDRIGYAGADVLFKGEDRVDDPITGGKIARNVEYTYDSALRVIKNGKWQAAYNVPTGYKAATLTSLNVEYTLLAVGDGIRTDDIVKPLACG